MLDIPLPEILRHGQVTVIAPGRQYENIYENMLGLFDEALAAASTVQPPLFLVDLEHTRHMGSAFLGHLLRMSNRVLSREGGRFGVCCLAPFCLTVLKTTRMNTVWELYETREAAVAALAAEAE